MEFGLHLSEPELSEKVFKNEIERYDWCEKQMQKVITDFLKDKEIAASQADNKFLEDLDEKVWINPQLKEHQEVEQFVCGFINKALHQLKGKDIGLDLKLIKSGSYYSNHRVGRPYEFDFLLEIPNDNLILDEKRDREFNFFNAALRADTNKWPFVETCLWTIDSEPERVLVYILQNFKEHLFTLLFDCINTVKKDYDDVEILRHKAETDNVPPALTLDIYYKNKYISLDLVPCFKYPYNVKNYKEFIPPAKKRLWEFLNRALSDKSSVLGETNLKGLNKYLYRDTLKSEIVGHICNSSGSCSKNYCGNDSNYQTTEPEITPNDDNQILGKSSPSMIGEENNQIVGKASPNMIGEEYNQILGKASPSMIGEENNQILDKAFPSIIGGENNQILDKASPSLIGEEYNQIFGKASPSMIGEENNQILGKKSPGMIGEKNKVGAADNCVGSHIKLQAQGLQPEISFISEISKCEEIMLEEKSLEQKLPMSSNEFNQSTKLVKPIKYDQAYSFFTDNLYLVIADKTSLCHLGESWSRLSTSLVENLIFSKLDDHLVRSLRIVKYFLQTFHIAIQEQENLDRAEKMGVPSLFPSRWITVIFLNLVLESDLFRTKLNLTERVAYLLSSLVTEGYDSLREKSDLGLFHYKNKFELFVNNDHPYPEFTKTWSIFKQSNLRTLLDFFTSCMHRKQQDVLHLTSLPNTCLCIVCFKQIYSTPFRKYLYICPWERFSPEDEHNYAADYPQRYCFMHEYILNQRVMCYDRYVCAQSEASSSADGNREDISIMASKSLGSRSTSLTSYNTLFESLEIQVIVQAMIAPLEEKIKDIKADVESLKMENRNLKERLNAREFNNI